MQTKAELTEAQTHAGLTGQPVTVRNNVPEQGVSCVAPSPTEITQRQEVEADILAVTVRLEMMVYAPGQDGNSYEYVDSSIGHATIKDGRYLVTHNHFSLPLQDINDGWLGKLSIRKATGEIILKDVPFDAFAVIVADSQTLVFDFGDYGGQGLFAAMGMPSAEFRSWESVRLQPGMAVAQVDWDGEAAHVDWVCVTAVQTGDETPQVVLANFVRQGASGGGIFYEGYHIANNWFRRTDRLADTGQVIQQLSVGALNLSGELPVERASEVGATGAHLVDASRLAGEAATASGPQ